MNTNPSCPYCASQELRPLGKLTGSNWFAGKHIGKPLSAGTLYLCRRCQLKFRYPTQDAATYQRLYDNAAVSTWPANAVRPDWDLITGQISRRLPQGGRVLDFGCYTGGLLARLGPTYERYGIEINKAAAAIADDNRLVQIWSSIDDIPGKLRFDVVIVADVIEHMPNPGHLIDRLSPLLKNGGILIITTGDANNHLWHRFGANWWYCFYPEHIAFLSEAWLDYYSHINGFFVEHCETFRYRRLSIGRLFFEKTFTYIYGYFPRTYLRLINTIRNALGRKNLKSVPGNGVSADHLFIVLARNGTYP